jgi:16S rRNA (cytidine1402-2'-O)-methyltransferase
VSPPGELVVVATPIGNLGDLSPRAVEVLTSADLVCCEDTRRTGLLLSRSGIRAKALLSLHAHNEAERIAEVLRRLEDGERVAVVTDAGTPGVSDPGGRLVSAAHDAGLRVSPVPGPSAALAAVSVGGLGQGRFRFEGFPPRRGSERAARLRDVATSPVPSVLYEAPGRVDALLADLASACSHERTVVVCRELTKLYEEVWRGSLGQALGRWPAATARGEFVLVVDGAPAGAPVEPPAEELAGLVDELVGAGSSRRDAIAEVARRLGVVRSRVYDAATRGTSAPKRREPAEGA